MVGLHVPLPEDGRHDGGPDVAEAAQDAVDELGLVDGVAEGVAEGRIEERLGGRAAVLDGLAVGRAVAVEGELGPAVGAAHDGRDAGLGLEGLQLVGVRVPGVVDLAGLEGLDHRVGALEELDDDLVRRPLLAPVLRVAHEPDVLARLPLLGDVRSGADERRLELGLADRLVVVGAPDVLGDDREVGLEDPVRRVRGGRDHRLVVGTLDLGDAGVLEARVEVPGADVGLVGDGGQGEAPRVAGVLRRGGRPVRPLHPGPDVERPRLPIGGALPAVGEAGDRLEIGPEVDEQVVGELEHLVPADQEGLVGVERVEVLDRPHPEDERGVGRAGRRRDRGQEERSRETQHGGQAAKALTDRCAHRCSSPAPRLPVGACRGADCPACPAPL